MHTIQKHRRTYVVSLFSRAGQHIGFMVRTLHVICIPAQKINGSYHAMRKSDWRKIKTLKRGVNCFDRACSFLVIPGNWLCVFVWMFLYGYCLLCWLIDWLIDCEMIRIHSVMCDKKLNLNNKWPSYVLEMNKLLMSAIIESCHFMI